MQEISLAGVQPYVTRFKWRDLGGYQETYETQFQADGHPIHMVFNHFSRSRFGDTGEWSFGFFVQNHRWAGIRDMQINWTTTAGVSAVAGDINTLRLFKTIGLAIRDFADTHANIDVIDITGADTSDDKEQQKSRIYARFLQTNSELADFRVEHGATKLYLVRKQARPDASGIDTPNNPNM